MSGGISVDDKLPQGHTPVLILFNDGECAVGWAVYWSGARNGEFSEFVFPMDALADGHNPTHWMPLPKPPAA